MARPVLQCDKISEYIMASSNTQGWYDDMIQRVWCGLKKRRCSQLSLALITKNKKYKRRKQNEQMPVITKSSPSPKSVKLVQTCHIQLTAYCNTKQFHRFVHNSKVIEILNEQLRPSIFKGVKLRWVWFNIFARHTIDHCGQDLACQSLEWVQNMLQWKVRHR